MSNNAEKSAVGGPGFTTLLTIAFIVLKLCHVIAWSWWWVLAPMWIVLLIIVVLAVIVFIAGEE